MGSWWWGGKMGIFLGRGNRCSSRGAEAENRLHSAWNPKTQHWQHRAPVEGEHREQGGTSSQSGSGQRRRPPAALLASPVKTHQKHIPWKGKPRVSGTGSSTHTGEAACQKLRNTPWKTRTCPQPSLRPWSGGHEASGKRRERDQPQGHPMGGQPPDGSRSGGFSKEEKCTKSWKKLT